jgi:putative hydrolase of the HAD superfamily
MKREAFEAIVFDLFHTLVDPETCRPEGFRRAHMLAEALRIEDVEGFARWWRQNEKDRHVHKSKKVTEFVDDYLWETKGRRCTARELDEIDQICGRLQDLAILNPAPDVLLALGELRDADLKLGLLSNIDEREARHWGKSPLAPLFDVVRFSFVIGYSKPSREAYLSILDGLGVSAVRSVYVGDGGHDELSGAKKAGFGFVVFMKGFISRNGFRSSEIIRKQEGEVDATITEIRELCSLLITAFE